MRSVLLLYLLFSLMSCYSQRPNNSLKDDLKKLNPKIKYQYVDSSQTHDYSGNWDFDNDGKLDKVLFKGNGGAHLYYFLIIELSSTKKTEKLEGLLIDFPLLTKSKTRLSQFMIQDVDGDGLVEILLFQSSLNEKESTETLVDFNGSKMIIKKHIKKIKYRQEDIFYTIKKQ